MKPLRQLKALGLYKAFKGLVEEAVGLAGRVNHAPVEEAAARAPAPRRPCKALLA